MPAPSQQQRVVRLDFEPSRERRNRFAELPGARLRDPEVDDPGNAARIGRERRLRFRDRFRIWKRAILDARGRPVLDRLRAGLDGTGRGTKRDRDAEDERQRDAPHYFTPAFALSSSNQLTMTLSRVGCESGSVLMKTKRFPSGDAAKS